MDPRRFDKLTKTLGEGTSRRQALKTLASGAGGGLAALFAQSASAAPGGKGGKGKSECCPADHPFLCGGLTCLDLQSDNNNCGACGNACPIGTLCVAGTCACPDGLTFCSGNCVDTSSDNNNCGACGNVCTGGATCLAGICVTGCVAGSTRPCYSGLSGTEGVGVCHGGTQTCQPDGTWGTSCDGEVTPTTEICDGLDNDCDGTPDNGFNLQTDLNNCGTCGNVCQTVNGTPACVASSCKIAGCNPGFGDCDGDPRNGCEVDILNDRNNCGSCGNTCPADSCSGSTVTTHECNNGACQSNSIACPGNLACSGNACLTTCTVDNDCTAGTYCDPSGACVAKKGTGVPCIGNNECISGNCGGGICQP